jgi:large subunit ribosomal protein L24
MKKDNRQNKTIRKGDKVIVIAGNDKGLVGTVLSRTIDRVTINGVNVRKRHVKKSQQVPQGRIVEIERPIHISNIAHCIDEQKPRKVRVGYDAEGKRMLIYREGDTEMPYRSVKKQSV